MIDNDYWKKRWISEEIGFHQKSYHKALENFWTDLAKDNIGNVFVPLCGKSLDMIFLQEKGHKVFGVDLSDIAVELFFKENNLQYKKTNNQYSHDRFSLFCDDLFNLSKDDLVDIKFIYDRAALVALPENLRAKYVKWIKSVLPEASIFLETFEFDNLEIGPPHSITMDMLNDYYGDFYHIEEKQLLDIELDKMTVHKGQVNYFKMRTSFLTPR